MIDIPEEIKNLFRSDRLSSKTVKKFRLTFYDDSITELYPYETLFPEENLFPSEHGEPWLVIENERIDSESLQIDESLCEDEDIVFGSCEGAQLQITVADVVEDVTGKEFTLTVEIGGYEMSLGIWTVKSFVRQSDRRKRRITAYDRMEWFNADVSQWYNELDFPMTIKTFRDSLCEYIGVRQETAVLLFDSVEISKTIEPESISGIEVLRAICEINGCFGHVDRTGILKYVRLQTTGIYPREDLFPEETLYPSELGGDGKNSETIHTYKQPMTYEDYIVEGISSLSIRQEEGHTNASVGDGENVYAIEGNFLVYGKSSVELLNMAASLLPYISRRVYRPASVDCNFMPWVEVGDILVIPTKDDIVETFCMKRTITGCQSMRDKISSTGSKKREESFTIHSQIVQLEGKTAVVIQSVEEVSAKVTDLKKETEAQLKVVSDEVKAEVKRAQDAEASLSVKADEISLKVDQKVSKGDVTSQLNSELKITGNSIALTTGHFTINAKNMTLDAQGNASFSGKISGGSININNNFTVDSSGKVLAKNIEVGTTSSKSAGYFSVLIASSHTCNDLVVQNKAEIDYLLAGQIDCNSSIVCSQIYSTDAGEWWSDKRLKYGIEDLSYDDAEKIISELQPVYFKMKKNNNPGMGFIAQDVKKICEKYRLKLPLYGKHDGYYTIPYTNFIPLIILVLKKMLKKEDRNESIDL